MGERVRRDAGALEPGGLEVRVDAGTDAPRVQPLALGPAPVRDEQRVGRPPALAHVQVALQGIGGGWVERDLLVLLGVALPLHAQRVAEQRRVEVLYVGADELDLGEAGVEHERHERAVAQADGRVGRDHLHQPLHVGGAEHTAGVLGRAAVALDGLGRVRRQVAAVDEVLAEAAEAGEVGRDADLAELARLGEVALVGLDVLLAELEALVRRLLELEGEKALELVQRAPIRPGRLLALTREVLGHEPVEPHVQFGKRKLERGGLRGRASF